MKSTFFHFDKNQILIDVYVHQQTNKWEKQSMVPNFIEHQNHLIET